MVVVCWSPKSELRLNEAARGTHSLRGLRVPALQRCHIIFGAEVQTRRKRWPKEREEWGGGSGDRSSRTRCLNYNSDISSGAISEMVLAIQMEI